MTTLNDICDGMLDYLDGKKLSDVVRKLDKRYKSQSAHYYLARIMHKVAENNNQDKLKNVVALYMILSILQTVAGKELLKNESFRNIAVIKYYVVIQKYPEYVSSFIPFQSLFEFPFTQEYAQKYYHPNNVKKLQDNLLF